MYAKIIHKEVYSILLQQAYLANWTDFKKECTEI